MLDDVAGSGGQVTNTYDVGIRLRRLRDARQRRRGRPGGLGDAPPVPTAQGTLAAGEHKTCTVANKRKPKLTVVKVIEGGNGAAFDLAVNGQTVLDDVSGSGGQVTNTYAGRARATRVTETLGNGDAVDPAVWETSASADCAGHARGRRAQDLHGRRTSASRS